MGIEGKPLDAFWIEIIGRSSDQLKAYCKVEQPFDIKGKFSDWGPVSHAVLTPRWTGVGKKKLLESGWVPMVFNAEICPLPRKLESWLNSNDNFERSLGFGTVEIGN